MKYVIDTSVAFKWAIAEIGSDKAPLLRDDEFVTADDKLVRKAQPSFPFVISMSALP